MEGDVDIMVKIGDSAGLILPADQMRELKLSPGDRVHVTANADGSVLLSPHASAFEKGLQIAEKAMKTYHNALTELAK